MTFYDEALLFWKNDFFGIYDYVFLNFGDSIILFIKICELSFFNTLFVDNDWK